MSWRVVSNGAFIAALVGVSACGATVPAPALVSAPESVPVTVRDRDLYEILARLAREPGSAHALAPHVESIHGPMEGIDPDEAVARGEPVSERVADPSALLAGYGEFVFIERDAALEDAEETEVSCTCDAALLTCTLYQSGGTTEFRFGREGERIVLTEHRWEYP